MRLLLLYTFYSLAASQITPLRIDPVAGNGALVAYRDNSGVELAPRAPLIYWSGYDHPLGKRSPAGWTIDLGPKYLTAEIHSAVRGKYGEQTFSIELRNGGDRTITGTLFPAWARWSQSPATVNKSSPEYVTLTADRAVFGRLGVMKAWSPGVEFESDVFTGMPATHQDLYLTAVLAGDPENVEHRRNEIQLKPGERRRYTLHLDVLKGGRNEALEEIYRRRGGYRVDPSQYSFARYDDPKMQWAVDTVATWLNWAWDRDNMNPETGEYRYVQSLESAKRLFGGYDVYVLWPFWPRAGYDGRSQFDHYRDMPGGLAGIREQFERMHAMNVRAFISYCHWSESDRDKSPAAMSLSYAQFADLACKLGADGALMDLMSKTPAEILARAKSCGRDLVPYNEGDPSWRDTQTNLFGRIHNDLAMPEFNLKKYLLPRHPQLRVCEPGNAGKRMRNDFVLSFFNGHGVEINTMFPANHPAVESDWPILARALDLLRGNRANFRAPDWKPLIPALDPEVWINEWSAPGKTIYTLCSTNPAGHHGTLLRLPHHDESHYVDLWRYRGLTAGRLGSDDLIAYDLDGYTPSLGSATGSGNFSPGCIASFHRRLEVSLRFETLRIRLREAPTGGTIEVWIGTVAPGQQPLRLAAAEDLEVNLYQKLHRETNEAIIVRLLDDRGQFVDIEVVPEAAVRFFRVDQPARTSLVTADEKPAGMVRIPGGRFRYILTGPRPPAEFPFAEPPFEPTYDYLPGAPPIDWQADLKPFWIDRYPVTNEQFADFLKATGYRPVNAANFLRHWQNGAVPKGLERHPVVYVSYEDAKAYCNWAGKRLPTEEEWQFAAGGGDQRAWPWGNRWDASRVNSGGQGTDPVDSHPSDESPYGVRNLIGNVWQWTASLMDNGRDLITMLRGGSWYRPPHGRWWVPGGPRRITENYPLPLDGPAMNRLATVGFRCVKDEAIAGETGGGRQ